MAFGRNKLMFSISILGFLIGSAAYFIFEWFFTSVVISSISIIEVLLSPWFLSGMIGSVLAIIVMLIYARTN